jgi:putative sterol carrier protein
MAHTIESLLAMLPGRFQADNAKGADTVIQLNVTGTQAGQWNVVIKDGKLNVAKGTHAAPELTVTADTADILAVANGELDPTKAFMQGKAKVTGDLTEAMGLIKLFKLN